MNDNRFTQLVLNANDTPNQSAKASMQELIGGLNSDEVVGSTDRKYATKKHSGNTGYTTYDDSKGRVKMIKTAQGKKYYY